MYPHLKDYQVPTCVHGIIDDSFLMNWHTGKHGRNRIFSRSAFCTTQRTLPTKGYFHPMNSCSLLDPPVDGLRIGEDTTLTYWGEYQACRPALWTVCLGPWLGTQPDYYLVEKFIKMQPRCFPGKSNIRMKSAAVVKRLKARLLFLTIWKAIK